MGCVRTMVVNFKLISKYDIQIVKFIAHENRLVDNQSSSPKVYYFTRGIKLV